MKKFVVGLLLIGLLVVSGCTQPYSPPANTSPSGDGTITLPGEPPIDRTWISPGKVQVGNFYPGGRAEWDLLVHNGSDTVASFTVAYRYPDHVAEGYAKPIPEVQDWVIIADPTPIILPKETKAILIVLEMPKDAAVFAPRWEFWISVKDTTQKGMVVTELASRWLVVMR